MFRSSLGQILSMSDRMIKALIITAIALYWVAFASLAWAHSWYDGDCCSEADCTKSSEVEELKGGYWIKETQEFVSEKDPRVRWSKDQDFHVCRPASWDHVRCLYRPQPGF